MANEYTELLTEDQARPKKDPGTNNSRIAEGHMRSPLSDDPPEVGEAMAKAQEYANLAALAKTAKDRNYYERLRRKWLGLAEGWRFIAEIDRSR